MVAPDHSSHTLCSRNVHRHKVNYNIYTEMEKYWNKERRYSILGSYLRSRNFTKELKSYGNYDYLIDTYTKRLNERNRDYEHYYFKTSDKFS